MLDLKIDQVIVFKDYDEEVEAVVTNILSDNEIEVLMINRGYYTTISPKDIIRVKK